MTHPGLVVSSMTVLILIEQTESLLISPAASLARAVAANLDMRKASDVKCNYIIVSVYCDKTSYANSRKNIKDKLMDFSSDCSKVLFVALGSRFANPNIQLVDLISDWDRCKGPGKVYGVHFQNISAMQAYHVKTKLKSNSRLAGNNLGYSCDEVQVNPGELMPIAVTGLVDNSDEKPEASFPVLLYMIHLAVGENGNRLSGKGIPSG